MNSVPLCLCENNIEKSIFLSQGIILLNKEPGLTSFKALDKIKKELGTRKIGHTGTLDSFAEGLLIVLAGKALKLAPWFTKCDKQYIGTICFGKETDTLDPSGKIIAEASVPLREDIEKALHKFTGNIMQSPPAYSAVHVNGKRASDLARAGEVPVMKERQVTVYKIELIKWEPPYAGSCAASAEIFVHCSSGTYIRSLARDIALSVSSRAHLSALKRISVGNFSLDMLGENDFINLPVDREAVKNIGLSVIEIESCDAQKIFHGKPLDQILCIKEFKENTEAAVFCEENLIAIVNNREGKWKYNCVFACGL